MVPAAIAFGWYDDPLFADAETSIEGFGIAASFMGAVALGVAVSAVRVKRRGHSHSWVASSAIAVSVVAIVTGLILPVSLLCHFKNSGPC